MRGLFDAHGVLGVKEGGGCPKTFLRMLGAGQDGHVTDPG